MKFNYQARNQEGQIRRGVVVAANTNKAEQLLTENGFIIISLEAQKESLFSKFNTLSGHVSYKDLVLFFRQLSTLIAAQVPILQSLRILEAQITNKRLMAITRDIISSIENGESFSFALSKHPQVFGNIYVSLIRSGEASGSVAQSLTFLADQLEKDYALLSSVKGALTYPAFVMVALFTVGILMFKFVLPKLTSVLKEQGGELPTVTIIIIHITDFIDRYWWAIIVVLAGVLVGGRFYMNTKTGRYQWDRLKLHLPIVGDIFQKVYLARFARNLATLVAGGIPIIQALQIIADVVNNVIYHDILIDVAAKVSNGNAISDSLVEYKEFPPIVTQMIKVGEQSGQLDSILNKLASFYEKEVDAKVSGLGKLLEPVVMVVLGIGVGALVAGILLPIYNLASSTT